jgi:hypothetical protein
LFRADDWQAGSMRVLNASNEALGISAGNKQFRLPRGKSEDFRARDWNEPFAVKIFRLEPAAKLVFSSRWRVASDGRELCFIGSAQGDISIRSLLDLPAPAPPPKDEP